MRHGGVVDADRDAGKEYAAAAVGEEAHPRTEAARGTLRGEGTRRTAVAQMASLARVRTAAGAQGTGKMQAVGT